MPSEPDDREAELQPETETELPVPRDISSLALLLDDYFRLPGTNYRFGLDGLLGLIPGIGDTLTTILGGYIVFRAHELGVPKRVLLRMLGNLGIDWAVGLVPLAGDLLDFGWKAHRKNLALLVEHLPDPTGTVSVKGQRVG